jgi:hypothetical protein
MHVLCLQLPTLWDLEDQTLLIDNEHSKTLWNPK